MGGETGMLVTVETIIPGSRAPSNIMFRPGTLLTLAILALWDTHTINITIKFSKISILCLRLTDYVRLFCPNVKIFFSYFMSESLM